MTGVIGPAGFIGSHMLARMVGLFANPLRLLVRRSLPAWIPGTAWLKGDLAQPGSCAEFVDGLDRIFYFAHENFPVNSDSDQCADALANLLPLLQLLRAIKNAGRKPHLVYLSSGGAIYGSSSRRTPFKESACCRPNKSYGVQKLAAEQYLRIAAEQRYLTATVLRPANVYGTLHGEERMQGLVGVAAARALVGKPIPLFGNLNNVRDYVHLDDLAEMIFLCVEPRERFRVFNVGSGIGHTVTEVLGAIESAIGARLETRHNDRPSTGSLPNWVVLDRSRAARERGWAPRIDFTTGIKSLFAGVSRQVVAGRGLVPECGLDHYAV